MHASMKRLHQVSGLIRKKDIADALGVAQSTVTNWGTRGVSREAAIDAAKLYGVEAGYILDGDTSEVGVAVPSNIAAGKAMVTPAVTGAQGDSRQILPVLSSVSKGDDTTLAGIDWIEKPFAVPSNGFALAVNNRAMSPIFSIGDYAVVDPDIDSSYLKDGDYVVAQHTGSDYGDVFKVVLYKSDDIRLIQINEQLGEMVAIPITDYHLFGVIERKVTKFR